MHDTIDTIDTVVRALQQTIAGSKTEHPRTISENEYAHTQIIYNIYIHIFIYMCIYIYIWPSQLNRCVLRYLHKWPAKEMAAKSIQLRGCGQPSWYREPQIGRAAWCYYCRSSNLGSQMWLAWPCLTHRTNGCAWLLGTWLRRCSVQLWSAKKLELAWASSSTFPVVGSGPVLGPHC